jgi:hypothetical protein
MPPEIFANGLHFLTFSPVRARQSDGDRLPAPPLVCAASARSATVAVRLATAIIVSVQRVRYPAQSRPFIERFWVFITNDAIVGLIVMTPATSRTNVLVHTSGFGRLRHFTTARAIFPGDCIMNFGA